MGPNRAPYVVTSGIGVAEIAYVMTCLALMAVLPGCPDPDGAGQEAPAGAPGGVVLARVGILRPSDYVLRAYLAGQGVACRPTLHRTVAS